MSETVPVPLSAGQEKLKGSGKPWAHVEDGVTGMGFAALSGKVALDGRSNR